MTYCIWYEFCQVEQFELIGVTNERNPFIFIHGYVWSKENEEWIIPMSRERFSDWYPSIPNNLDVDEEWFFELKSKLYGSKANHPMGCFVIQKVPTISNWSGLTGIQRHIPSDRYTEV